MNAKQSLVGNKCKHTGGLRITETGSWYTSHYRKTNGEWWHNNEPGSYYDKISLECYECGMEREYDKRRAPEWVKKALEAATECSVGAA